eukprot:COSAG05_NODE_129_length_17200_cov_47.810128_8_plen_54_part_00
MLISSAFTILMLECALGSLHKTLSTSRRFRAAIVSELYILVWPYHTIAKYNIL